MNRKPKIAIYDLTDCEGCEVKLVSLRERLVKLLGKIEIVNWRLGQSGFISGPYDITIIEGGVITPHEIELVKELRQNSKVIIALGACASIGGIPSILPQKERDMWYKKIYGENYVPQGIDALPLHRFIKTDYHIHGCPVDEDNVMNVFEDILAGKKPYNPFSSVCFDCKVAGNHCSMTRGIPCMGPVTQAGCKAVCISGGSPCYGCFGLRDEASMDALKKQLIAMSGEETAQRFFSMFLNQAV